MSVPSREELLARAEALIPVLRRRAIECERLRSCPPETIAEFQASGLLRICQPTRFGGYALGWDVRCEVSQTLARGCGSQAWVHNILTDHSQKLGAFPLAAQEDVWGRDSDTRLAAGLDPVGKARRVAGGVIYSGRHSFSSGIDHVQWVICGGHIAEAQGPPRRGYFLVPKSDIRVIDDWHVAGLAGTGSKSFEVSEIFVPAHRILDGEASDDGRGPGTEADPAPIFRMPRSGIPGTGFAAVTVGMAQGFVAEWIDYTRPRKSRGLAVADLMGTQISAGLATAQVDAAGRLYLGATREVMRTLERGGKVGPEQRLHTRLCTAYAGQLVLAAVNRLSNAAGGRAFYTSNDLQRQFRDITMAAAHYSLAWDNVAAAYGKHMLGAEP